MGVSLLESEGLVVILAIRNDDVQKPIAWHLSKRLDWIWGAFTGILKGIYRETARFGGGKGGGVNLTSLDSPLMHVSILCTQSGTVP